ncbi:Anaerobic dimethyl sulfoxide reductase chain A, molybdopterin-binding domain, partial [hydrothermal vent metagenome]
RVKGQAKLISGVNKDVVWTWNAIGKRKGAWGLQPGAPEFTKGFLLNHIISDVLADKHGEKKYSNSDPVTGQAAWYDLRVKITKCKANEAGATEPMYEAFDGGPIATMNVQRYGADMKGASTGGSSEILEYVGQRHSNALAIDGIRDGHGNQIKEEQE